MKAFIASDHAGLELKKGILRHLKAKGVKAEDLGPENAGQVDYPDFAKKVAKNVAAEKGSIGVLICGSGIGMSIAANKVKGIRAAKCNSVEEARLSRQHNNANVLCLGARILETNLALEIVDAFIETPFSGDERHKRRVEKMDKMC
ncbi:MAG: ribose 5-phosphate isomerase B [Candidatus Diapherotrites archaeon]